jgi:hypothetical protein
MNYCELVRGFWFDGSLASVFWVTYSGFWESWVVGYAGLLDEGRPCVTRGD